MIQKVCVIGSGVMGAGIAAQIANSGNKVLLLDIKVDDSNRNSLAQKAIKNITHHPEILAHESLLGLIDIGNLEDNLNDLRECDWIIEVVIEDLEIKRNLFKKIIPFLKPGAYISSNTSTIPLNQLKNGFSLEIKEKFYITHFFNPPRQMRLLELITGENTSKESIQELYDFINIQLGKGIVNCNDTPGFIANRIGCFLLEHTVRCAIEFNIEIEVIDDIFEKLLGFPKTGIFGLMDLIGLDVMAMIAKSLISLLPPEDRFNHIYTVIPQIQDMINQGYIGRKGKGGFYKILKEGDKKVKQVYDFKTRQYKEAGKISIPKFSSIEDLLETHSAISGCFRKILVEFGIYVCSLVPEVCESPSDIDRAMKLGYNWKYGPFELIAKIDKFGFDYLIDNAYSFDLSLPSFLLDKKYPPHNNKVESDNNTLLKKAKIFDAPIMENSSAKVFALKDNILCFYFTSKMNILNNEIFQLLEKAIDLAEKEIKPLIIYNELHNFSLGADLKALVALKSNSFQLENFLKIGQKTMNKVKYAKTPIIACSKNYALGGGCELLLHATHLLANLETFAGLVEVGIGLIPGWGGLKEMVIRSGNDTALLRKNLMLIIDQNKTKSAYSLRSDYKIEHFKLNMNIDLLLEEAIYWGNILIKDFKPRSKQPRFDIPFFSFDKIYLDSLKDSHTHYIATQLSTLSSLKNVSEEDLLDFERNLFMELIYNEVTIKKIEKIIN